MVGESVSTPSGRHIGDFEWFDTKLQVEAIISEEWRNSSCFRMERVCRELGKRKLIYLVVLEVGYVGSEELF